MENKNRKAGINQPENISLPFKIEECLAKGLMLELIMRLGKESLDEMIEDDIEKLCGARYVHNPARENSRWSRTKSEVTLGGCKAGIEHSRVRNVRSREEVKIPVLKTLKNLDLLQERHAGQMILGVSTRKVKRSLEGQTAFKSYGTSKSAVSRNFVSLTRKKLADWLGRDLDTEYPFIMIDGISFRGKTVLIALGISKDGHKSVLGAWEGSTENARVCTDLLQNLIERGLHQESVKLLIMDGGKGIHKAVRDVFGNNILIQRCQIHKKRNVKDYLPENMKTSVESIMNDAYSGTDYARSKKMLENLAASLRQKGQEPAAASLMEGLEETLTLLRLGAPEEIQKTLSNTNAIENLNGSIRRMTQRVKKWSGNNMLMRWISSALIESEGNFRRVKGYRSIPVLLDRISQLNNFVLPEVA